MNPQLSFQPRATSANPPDHTVQVTVTTSWQALTLPASHAGGSMRLTNSGAATVAWCYGSQNALTVATGVQLLPNTSAVFGLPQNATQLSVIGSAAGSTLSVTVGDGGI